MDGAVAGITVRNRKRKIKGRNENADENNEICVKTEIEFENENFPETKENFNDESYDCLKMKCEEESLDSKTPVRDVIVKEEIVDEEHFFTVNSIPETIKEESIDIFDEHIDFPTQIKREDYEFSEFSDKPPGNEDLNKTKDESRKVPRKRVSKNVKSSVIMTSDNRFACKHCRKSYKYKFHAYRHLSHTCRGSGKQYECKTCGRIFSVKDSLKRHEFFLHSDRTDRYFVCHKCERKYWDKSGLRRHLKFECEQEPRFSCAHCDYRTVQKVNLIKHFARLHAELTMTRVGCPSCDKSYKNECSLKRHLQFECGKEKAFACKICGFKTKRKSYLASHERNKHSEGI